METEVLRAQLRVEQETLKLVQEELKKTKAALSAAETKLNDSNQNLPNENKVQKHSECLKSKQYADLAESIQEFIYYADLKGHFIFMNQKGPEKFGYSFDDLSGKHFTEFVHPHDVSSTKKFYKEMIQNRIDQSYFEFRVMTKNNTVKWVGQSVSAVKENGQLTKFAAVARDITKLKLLEIELNEAKDLAEASQKAEKQFLTNMSHEIRTPLNAIIGMSHLIQDTEMSHEQEEYMDILFSSAQILHALISDILDFSKIDSGNIEVHEKVFDIHSFLNNLNKTFSVKLENKPIEFICEVDPLIDTMILSDEVLLNQIFFNLIGNAEKFTDKGEIKLKLTVQEKTDNDYKVKFEVSDTGIGISQEDQVKIFQQFVQVSEERKYSYGGTGLGLPITKKVLDLLGGTLNVESELNKGTTFSFELKLKKSTKPLNKNHKIDMKNEQFLTSEFPILVVEDNVMNRKYIKRLLNKWSLEFEIAVNGLEAVEKCKAKKYSLVFMDIQMPIMDGYEATDTIRKECELNLQTPIIALTASSMISMKNKAFELGMNDFLSKPFNPFQLAEMLRIYLKPDAHKDDVDNVVEGGFRFDQNLNTDYLKEAYGEDLDDVIDMFETFLEVVDYDYPTLLNHVETGDMDAASRIIHKMKPIFTMVGLNKLTDEFQKLEQLAKANDTEAFHPYFKKIEKRVSSQIDLIKSETNRLSDHLRGKQ